LIYQISLNGEKKEIQLGDKLQILSQLVECIESNLNKETQVISELKLGGISYDWSTHGSDIEINSNQLSEIEVWTKNPKEIAIESLEYLKKYCSILIQFCDDLKPLVFEPQFERFYVQLIDGLMTFSETLSVSKKILLKESIQNLDLLENDLKSIIKDMHDSKRDSELEYFKLLLSKYLPQNLLSWQNTGINQIIRLHEV
tara:strand:- start:1411 stop:2010 length:600 start_codon:yes stop_codon:yes gene_type:complete